MNDTLSKRITALPNLDKRQLLEIWGQVFPAPPPAKLHRHLMLFMLAYRLQEQKYGGLSHSARKRLRDIARGLGQRRTVARTVDEPSFAGTELIRLWRGETHEVMCRDGEYEYRGQQFSSLSRIAKQITGTQWSGPAFFGTREKAK